MPTERRLAAILSADVVGYSRLMAADEAGTVGRLKTYRDAMDSLIRQHGGRVVDAVGDNLLGEFPSVVDAVACSVAVQEDLAKHNESLPDDRSMRFRIGINLGDVIVDDDRIYGDGVNIAARIEALAEPGEVSISGTAFDQVEGKLGLDFEDQGEHEVKNIPRPVRIYRVRTSEASEQAAKLTVPGFGGRPAVAVLPFQSLSSDPDQEYFTDGVVADLITRLSSLRVLPVISRSSTLEYRGKSVDVQRISAKLGVRYVVEGTVRKAGRRIRISAQLIDATTGHQLWSQRLDRELEDLFELQDEIVDAIAGELGGEIRASEGTRASRLDARQLDAWELTARGWSVMTKPTPGNFEQARELFNRAVELDPTLSRAWVGLSRAYSQGAWFSERLEESIARAVEAAERAVEIDPRSGLAHCALGIAMGFRGEPERHLAELERAIELSPSDALIHGQHCYALAYRGRPDEGIEAGKRAIRLSPNDPEVNGFLMGIARACYAAGRDEEAADWAERARLERSDSAFTHAWLAAIYARLGRVEAARQALERWRQLNPNPEPFLRTSAKIHEADGASQVFESFLEGLRKAGWEDEPE